MLGIFYVTEERGLMEEGDARTFSDWLLNEMGESLESHERRKGPLPLEGCSP